MKQVRMFRALGFAAITLMVSLTLTAQGDLAPIQQKLQQSITLATLDSNGEITTAGSVVTLLRNSLQMCSTLAPAGAGAPNNTYKNGKLSAGMFSWNLGLGLLKIDPNSIPMHTSVAGEKFWIVHYNVKKNGVEFKIWTDPDSNNVRYWTWLVIPFDKKQVPSPDEFMKTLAEVITIDNQAVQQVAAANGPATESAQDGGLAFQGKYVRKGKSNDFLVLGSDGVFFVHQDGKDHGGNYKVEGEALLATFPRSSHPWTSRFIGDSLHDPDGMVWEKLVESSPAPAPEAAAVSTPTLPPSLPPPAPMPALVPPPPPADAPLPTIELGQTMDQVTAGFGQPLRVAKLGVKTIFYYKDMKVTFTNGKVSNVE